MAEGTSATCTSKKLEMKDARETPALRCCAASFYLFFGPVSDVFSLIFGCCRGRCSLALPSHSLSGYFCSNSAPSFPARKDLDTSSLLQGPHDSVASLRLRSSWTDHLPFGGSHTPSSPPASPPTRADPSPGSPATARPAALCQVAAAAASL